MMTSLPKNSRGITHLFPLLILASVLFAIFGIVYIKNGQDGQRVLSESESDSSSSGSSGSGSSGSDSASDDDEDDDSLVTPEPTGLEKEEDGKVDDDQDEDEKGLTRIRVAENETRLEQEFFEGGLRKRVELRNENGRVSVRIKTEDAAGNETVETLDLRPEDGRVTLKVEVNGVEQEVTVKSLTDRFVIEHEGFATTTQFPLTIDTENNILTVTTPFGVVNVRELPSEAIQNMLAQNAMDQVLSTELTESGDEDAAPNEQVVFKVKGIKNAKFLGIFDVEAPILAEVSATTGLQTFFQEPWFLRAFGFLFTN